MSLQKIIVNGVAIVEGPVNQHLMVTEDDIMFVLDSCANEDSSHVLLYSENLPNEFFNLKSRQAGNMLQKLRNYNIKLAVILTDSSLLEGRFGEMVNEEKAGSDFAVFSEREPALKWLSEK